MANNTDKIFRIVVDYRSGVENLNKVNAALKEAQASTRKLAIERKNLDAQLRKCNLSQEEYKQKMLSNTHAEIEHRKTILALSEVRRKANIEVKKMATAEVSAKGSINELSARLSVLRMKYSELTPAQRKSASEGRALLKQIQMTSKEYKKLEMSMGNTGVNAGNYRALYNKFTTISAAIFGLKQLVSTLITPFKDFEYAMDKVQAVSNATDAEIKQLEADARKLGETTEYTAAQVSELQLNYARLGFSPDEILEVTDATLDLATATGEDLARSADIAGATLRGFGLEASQMPRVIDVMAGSFNNPLKIVRGAVSCVWQEAAQILDSARLVMQRKKGADYQLPSGKTVPRTGLEPAHHH